MACGIPVHGGFVCLFLTVFQLPMAEGTGLEVTQKDELLNNSRVATVRPDRVTFVYLAFNLMSINKVNWMDHRLRWNHNSQYSIVKVLQVASKEIWAPTLVNENSIYDLGAIREPTIPVRVLDSGQVTFNPPGILVTNCEMEVSKFPFDTQVCSIEVTSLGYSVRELDLGVKDHGVVLKFFKPNGEWDLNNIWSESTHFTEEHFTYAKVTFFFQLKRRAMYHGLNTMLPVMLNSLLVPLVFLLPHDAGEKIGYCLTVLLAYVVLLTIVSDGLPTTAKSQSLLGLFIAMVLMMSGLSVMMAIHSLSIFHRRAEHSIPDWQARLTRFIMHAIKCRFIKRPKSSAVSPSPHLIQLKALEKKAAQSHLNGKGEGCITKEDTIIDPLSMKILTTDETSVASDGMVEMTWQLVAQTYDAFFLRLYFLIIISSCIGFFVAISCDKW